MLRRQQRVEQGLVGILQAAQEHVALYIAAKPAKSVEPAHDLRNRGSATCGGNSPCRSNASRSSSVKAVPLLSSRIVEQLIAAQRGFDVWRYRSAHRSRHPTASRYRRTGSLNRDFYDSLVTRRGFQAGRHAASSFPNRTPLASLPMALRMTMATRFGAGDGRQRNTVIAAAWPRYRPAAPHSPTR